MAVITNGPATLLAQGSPPFNGAINSNQTNTVSFTLLNIGSGPTTNLVATLLANSGIRPITVSQVYGPIAVGGSASKSFAFVGSGSSGATITAELSLKDEGNTNLGPVFYTFMIPMTQSFSNSGTITIPYIGPGSPYPSSIQISGLTNGLASLWVSKVTATLNDFTHSWPHDVEAVLVSPAGQELVLMEHTGAFYSVTNLVLTFDDAAAQSLPLNSTLFSGTFLATEYTPFDILPGLAAVPAANTNLAVFNGENPNGIWSLYVYDDTEGNDGVITSGWSLGLTAVSPLTQAASLSASRMAGELLQLSVSGSPGQSYGIQISSNLVSWTTIMTNTGSFIFTDSLTNAPERFYRAIQLPQ
jgi:subtilisin-like proprotein convertase family protein